MLGVECLVVVPGIRYSLHIGSCPLSGRFGSPCFTWWYNSPSWSFVCSLAPDLTPGGEPLCFLQRPYGTVSRIALSSPLGQEVRTFSLPRSKALFPLNFSSEKKNADRKTPTCKIWRPIIREKILKIKRFQARVYSASQSGTSL